MASRKRTHSQVEEPSLKERARNACASGQGSTTSELRDIARQLGIRNVSSMSKTKLCEVIHTNISQDEPAYPVTLDESDIPDGLQDPISLELMQDPIIASDGYSYDRVTLRNLFVAAQREFVASGRPANRPVTVRSLFNRDVVLVNPFGDIGGLPPSFPLIENKSLARTIAEWRIQHGFDAPDPSEIGAAAAIHAEPPESHRDNAGFHNGIFFGPPSLEEDEDEDEEVEEHKVEEEEIEERDQQDNRVTYSRRNRMGVWLQESIRLDPLGDIQFRQLWDNYHQTQSRHTLVSMLISVRLGLGFAGSMKMEYGVIDMLKPEPGATDTQAMNDWLRYFAKKALRYLTSSAILSKREVQNNLDYWSTDIKWYRENAPRQFELFLDNRSDSILEELFRTAEHYSPSQRSADVYFEPAAMVMLAPRIGQSWIQWKTMVLRIVKHMILTAPERGPIEESRLIHVSPATVRQLFPRM